MTVAKRYLAESKDVLAVRVVCHCGATVSIPPKPKFGIPFRCSNCHDTLIDTNSRENGLIDNLIRTIADLSENKYPWKIQLEFELPPSEQ